jgi:hypothetical protein
MQKVRMTIYISPILVQKINQISSRLEISKAAVANLALQAGLKSLEMAGDPNWQTYFEKMIQEGRPILLPDGAIMGSEELPDPNDPNDLRNYPDFPG